MKLFINRFSTAVSKCKPSWQPVIGLEIHAQINAKSKLFSPSATQFGVPTNSQVSFFDASFPGTLPVLNIVCVEKAVKTALALNSKINKCSTFDRKHYFYADLPMGFQITQQRNPIAKGGFLVYMVRTVDSQGRTQWLEKQANFIQIQLEQDSGKSLHDAHAHSSLIDLNRAGIGLLEIITHPDFTSSSEAVSFVRELQFLLQTLDSCQAKMEEGGLRVDASVSIRKRGNPLGTRTEIKNLNSLRSLGKAIDFEIGRQISELEKGRSISNDTLSFNVDTNETIVMRDKEKLHDYRFMPEPNLPPLILQTNENDHKVQTNSLFEGSLTELKNSSNQFINIDLIASQLPELPHNCRQRIMSEYNLSITQAFVLVSMPTMLTCFQDCLNDKRIKSKMAANFFLNEILSILNEENVTFELSGMTSFHISQILLLVENKKISLQSAKEVLKKIMADSELTIESIIKNQNYLLITNDDLIRPACIQVINDNPDAVHALKSGKIKTLNFFVGQVQKEMKGKGDGAKIIKIIKEIININ